MAYQPVTAVIDEVVLLIPLSLVFAPQVAPLVIFVFEFPIIQNPVVHPALLCVVAVHSCVLAQQVELFVVQMLAHGFVPILFGISRLLVFEDAVRICIAVAQALAGLRRRVVPPCRTGIDAGPWQSLFL